MSNVRLETFPVGPLGCNCTIAADASSGEAVVVDGGDGVDDVTSRLEARGWRAKVLIHTHAHIDHVYDIGGLKKRTGAPALLHVADLPLYRTLAAQAAWLPMYSRAAVAALDGELREDAPLRCGALRIDVLHTPGHTPGSVCFALDTGLGAPTILSGDTLFAGAIGRWDLGGTSMEDIVASIHRKLLDFPDESAVIPGHGPATSIGIERNANPYLQ